MFLEWCEKNVCEWAIESNGVLRTHGCRITLTFEGGRLIRGTSKGNCGGVEEMKLAWLIEDELGPQARWWCGESYSTDANEAIRFCRKEDAEKVIRTILASREFSLIATEHGWPE